MTVVVLSTGKTVCVWHDCGGTVWGHNCAQVFVYGMTVVALSAGTTVYVWHDCGGAVRGHNCLCMA